MLFEMQVESEYQVASLDLCAATPMPIPEPADAFPPKLLAFYYQWWRAESETCGEDLSGGMA